MEFFSVQMQRLQEVIVPRLVMLVLLVMAMFEMGRGPGNVLWGPLVIIGSLIVLANYRLFVTYKWLAISYFGFIACITLSALSFDASASPVLDGWPIKYWLSLICSSLVFFLVQLIDEFRPKDWIISAQLALFSVCMVVVSWLYYLFTLSPDDYNPATQVSSTICAVVAPWVFLHSRWSVLIKWAIMMSLLGLLMLLDSRTEVLAVLAGVAVYQICIWRRLRLALFLLPFMLVLLLAPEIADYFSSRQEFGFDGLNYVSSRRIEIWQAAWLHCQDNIWFGHGIYSSVRASFLPDDIRHIHNVLLEIVYESGLVGLLCISVFMSLAYFPLIRGYKTWPKRNRRLASVILAATAATLVALFFDKSLHSVFARYYLFFLAGLAYWLARQPGVLLTAQCVAERDSAQGERDSAQGET